MMNELKSLEWKRCSLGGLLCALLFVLLNFLLYTETFKHIGEEDGVVENVGAICFMITAILFFLLFWRLKKSPAKIPAEKGLGAWIWYLLLAVLFFFVTGEEISWGQRIFGWSTPEWMEESNVQGETTIHNLEVFNAHTKDHELKPFWQSLLTMNRMFSLFWLAWCFVMPLAMIFSANIRALVQWFRVPVPRYFYGCLFLCTFIAAKSFVIIMQPEELIVAQLDEIKECFYAIFFLMVAWNFYQRFKRASN